MLHNIFQNIQTMIEQLQRNDFRFKLKNYTKILRIVIKLIAKLFVVNKSINLKMTKQTQEFIIVIVNDNEQKILKNMIIKNIIKKLNVKKVRNIT